MRTALKHEEIVRLNQDGVVTFGRILTDAELVKARANVDRAVTAYTKHGNRPEKLDFIHTYDDYFASLVAHPRLLDVVESVIGPDIVLFSSHLLCKPDGDGREVAWHQDGAYWPIEPMNAISLWLALDDCDAENGCMRMIPGTHIQGRLDHSFAEHEDDPVVMKTLDQHQYNVADAVDVCLKAGECSLHLPWIIHGSNANHSSRRRAGLPIRYIPGSTRVAPVDELSYNPDFPRLDYRKNIRLLRGQDQAGNFR